MEAKRNRAECLREEKNLKKVVLVVDVVFSFLFLLFLFSSLLDYDRYKDRKYKQKKSQ